MPDPEPTFACAPQSDGSVDVNIPPEAMQGMSPVAMVGLIAAIARAAPAIMALLPQIRAIWDQIAQQLPQPPTGATPS